jgi:hypothetical protein
MIPVPKHLRRLTEEDIVERATSAQRRYKNIMAKRKQESFYFVDPRPRMYVTSEEYARRVRSQFERDLIAKHESAQATRAGYLISGFALLCFAACLIWKFWG